MSVHNHQRSVVQGRGALSIAFGLTVVMMVVECVAGLWSGSLSLLADAGHMLTDAGALGLSLFAVWLAAKPATIEKTYGYHRTEILAALANGLVLWVIVIWIYVRAWHRLSHPVSVESGAMIGVATIGLCVNLLSGVLLTRGKEHSLNIRSAWLNVMSDALGSLGVIVAGCVIQWFGWTAADPVASLVIGALIAVNAWNLVRQAVNVLLEASPHHVRTPEVIQAVRMIPGVCDVHDVHLWTITTGMDAMSGHVSVEDLAHGSDILSQLQHVVSTRFGITHTTFQLEPREHTCPWQSGIA